MDKICTIISLCIGAAVAIPIGVEVALDTELIFFSFIITIVLFFLTGIMVRKVCELCMQKSFSFERFKPILINVVCISVIAVLCTQCDKIDFSDSREEEDLQKILREDPNTWTEDEKECVDDFFDWMSEEQRKN